MSPKRGTLLLCFYILIHLKKASQAGNHPNQEVIYNSLTPGIGGFQPGLESSYQVLGEGIKFLGKFSIQNFEWD